MPPVIKLNRSDTSPTMSSVESPKEDQNYYNSGSADIVKETPLTVSRLEQRRKLTKTSNRLVIVLVGLPARGKSFISRKLLHYVNWTGVRCKAFNVGKYRREAYAQVQASTNPAAAAATTKVDASSSGACDADFFSAENAQAAALRQHVAQLALDDMLKWLDEEEEDYWDENPLAIDTSRHSSSGAFSVSSRSRHQSAYQKIAIFDATNSTEKRRQWVLEQCTSPEKRKDKPTGVVFVESICTDEELLEENYRFKVSNSPDYKNMTIEEGMKDLLARVRNYEDQYETIQNDNISYIKIFDLSTKLMVNHIYGRMAKDLVPALMAWHIGSRPVFLVRPGRTASATNGSDADPFSSDGGLHKYMQRRMDSSVCTSRKRRGDTLNEEGLAFRDALFHFLHAEVKEFILKRRSVADGKHTGTSVSGLVSSPYFGKNKAEEFDELMSSMSGLLPIRVLASTMPRAVETVSFDEYDIPCSQMSNLNPIDKGDYAGMELEDIKLEDPEFYQQLQCDPFNTRFPGGESYHDLVRRLNTVVIDMEQQVVPVVVVSHVSSLQCLMAYFRNKPVHKCMSEEVPMHTVIKFEPVRGGGWQESWHPLDTENHKKEGMVVIPSEGDFSTLSHEADGNNSNEAIWWGENIANQQRLSPKTANRVIVS